MKKASDICLIIGGVLAILCAIGFLVSGIIMLVFASPQFKEMIIKGLEEGTIHTTLPGTPEQVAAIVQQAFLIAGACFLPGFILAVLSAVFSFLGPKKASNTIYILNIVFGVLGGSVVNTIGGIIGILVPQSERKNG